VNRFYITIASLGLACLAADAGDWDLEARYRQDSVRRMRAHLGREQFDRAHAKGMALSFDEAIDLATEKTPSPLGSQGGEEAPGFGVGAQTDEGQVGVGRVLGGGRVADVVFGVLGP
jgi:hypothetical protein